MPDSIKRPTWEEYALLLAEAAALRSEDPWVKVGAVVLRHDKSVCAVGYNGAPSGVEIDWSSRNKRRGLVIHAEANALRWCSPGECHLIATTLSPCPECLKQIAAYRIHKAVFRDWYSTDPETPSRSTELAELYQIELCQILKA